MSSDAITVRDERVPVQQFLALTLLDRSGIPRESLSGGDRRTALALLEQLRPLLVIDPPSAFPSTPLSLATPFASTRKSSPVAVPDIATVLDVYLHRDGRLTGAALFRVSARPSTDTTLLRSVRALTPPDSFAQLAARLTKDSIGIRLEATIDGCGVRQMVEQPFGFSIR